SGALNVSGAGSLVSITLARPFSVPGLVFPLGLAVGRFGSGTVTVSDGGMIVLNDSGTTGQGGMQIGGNFDCVNVGFCIKDIPPANGAVTVTGRGSKIVDNFSHGFIDVGYEANGTGSLAVTDSGSVSAEQLDLGTFTGSKGTLTI